MPGSARGAANADETRQIAVARAMIRDLLAAVRELRPRFGLQVTKDAVLTATSFVPGVGQAVASAVAIEEAARSARRYRRSWYATLEELER